MKFAITLLAILLVAPCPAQPPDTLWTRMYGTPDDDEAFAIAPAADGGFFLAGHAGDPWGMNPECFVIRCDSSGNVIWSEIFGGASTDVATAVTAAADGGCIVAGYGIEHTEWYNDIEVARFDSAGQVIWNYYYGGADGDAGHAVAELPNGNIVVAGYTFLPPPASANLLLMKIHSDGTSPAYVNFGWDDQDVAQALVLAANGDCIVAGWGFGEDNAGAQGIIARVNIDTGVVWVRTYGGPSDELFYALCEVEDSSYLAAGQANEGDDPFLVKVNATGDTVWTRRYPFDGEQVVRAVLQTNDENYTVAGYNLHSLNDVDMFLMKIDTSGSVLWSRDYDLSADDRCFGLHRTTGTEYLLAGCGMTQSDGCEMLVIKTGPEFIEVADNFFNPHPSSFILSAYPNPFNSATILTLTLPIPVHARLSLCDITGREALEIAERRFESGEHTFTLDASALASGVYFVSLTSETQLAIQKLLLLK